MQPQPASVHKRLSRDGVGEGIFKGQEKFTNTNVTTKSYIPIECWGLITDSTYYLERLYAKLNNIFVSESSPDTQSNMALVSYR